MHLIASVERTKGGLAAQVDETGTLLMLHTRGSFGSGSEPCVQGRQALSDVVY